MVRNVKGQFKSDLFTGKVINQLTIFRKVSMAKNGTSIWECICECGNNTMVSSSHLTGKKVTKSCGCLRHQGLNKKHGLKDHPIYGIWSNMKGRCLNKNFENYKNYGGRGISVCEPWLKSFVNFYNDMKDGYVKGLHIGRIDNNGNYCKENCQWETPIENMNNKRTSIYICVDGINLTAAEWGRKTGVKRDTICNRKRKGYTDYECIYGR